ncbi:phosphoribosylformylglycinamidine synthase I [Candidatus Saccharibacteria bacterium]|nr:phosphoribosylformylglycinamidine synthase I [Candidatus Saccharibacteria bacterium]
MSLQPTAAVLNYPGINCNIETGEAFELAGAMQEQVFYSELKSGEKTLNGNYQFLVIPGGFSDGDDIAAGRTLGIELRTNMTDELNRFVEAGGVIIGICNGFQVLVETGLLPNGKASEERDKTTALAHNERDMFDCRWGKLKVEDSRCPFITPAILGDIIELPWAHGEGRFLRNDPTDYQRLLDNGQVVLRYANEGGVPTTDWPENPNGSPYGITGLCDESGLVVGMMPHPERFVSPELHPNYHRNKILGETVTPHGLAVIKSAVDFVKAA